MNLTEIQQLADILRQSGLTELEVEEGGLRVRLAKGAVATVPAAPSLPATEQALPASQQDESGLDFNRIIEVKSPIVGVFYASPSPDAEPFVRVGSKVKKGDVLCIVDAMKLMNEIIAETDGEVVDICLKNGDLAEYGQVLFKLY